MPRYYFDIHDGRSLIRDDIGIECDNPDAIRTEAIAVLPAIARDVVPINGDRQALMIIVRNTRNMTVYTAIMNFASIWLGEGTPTNIIDVDEYNSIYFV